MSPARLSVLLATTMLCAVGVPFALAATKSAPAVRETLTLRWSEAWNRHHTDGGGDSERTDATVTATLFEDGTLRVEDTGTQMFRNLFDGGHRTEETTIWTHRWTGEWERAKGTLSLRLKLAERTCEVVKTSSSTAEVERSKCARSPKKMLLRCAATKVAIEDGDEKRAAWSCEAAGKRTPTGTRMPWVFGKDSCLASCCLRGPGRRSEPYYRTCASLEEGD